MKAMCIGLTPMYAPAQAAEQLTEATELVLLSVHAQAVKNGDTGAIAKAEACNSRLFLEMLLDLKELAGTVETDNN